MESLQQQLLAHLLLRLDVHDLACGTLQRRLPQLTALGLGEVDDHALHLSFIRLGLVSVVVLPVALTDALAAAVIILQTPRGLGNIDEAVCVFIDEPLLTALQAQPQMSCLDAALELLRALDERWR